MTSLTTIHTSERCCNETWEQAYARFETPEQEVDKFLRRFDWFGAKDWPKDAAIVELFCGRGNGLVALSQLGFTNLSGVDLSADLLGQYTGDAQTYVCDARDLSLETASQDIAVVQGGVHHLPELPADLEKSIEEAARVLRPGGKLVMVEPWDTPFLRAVHAASANALLRRLWGKLDAFQVLYENERQTYDNWLSRPVEVLGVIEKYFHIERQRQAWGKLFCLARRRESASLAKAT
ncbi:MAG: class I SAM-dependent methyltransferase [Phycisphaeraceae bacterium]|nr:class I SAM-dependent methyltransferase [Phycisphaeraceae bacterium]